MVPEDVRFLLVHHTATSNRIPDQRQLIRNIFAFHTSNAKRWNDVAYNYFVGPDGTVWEGRAGSLDGPVVADATGGQPGFQPTGLPARRLLNNCAAGGDATQSRPAARTSLAALQLGHLERCDQLFRFAWIKPVARWSPRSKHAQFPDTAT